jgi:uncharacterized GH25 family protein
MKKQLLLILALMVCGLAYPHALWIETAASGKINQKQEVKVYFGEYAYGVREDVKSEAFNNMKAFEVWAVAPTGEKTVLALQPGQNFYSGWFTPKVDGTYTIVLNNNKIDVIDYTQYNFGIFKTHYHAVAKVQVGSKSAETTAANPEGITLIDASAKGQTVLKVLYKGQPLAAAEVVVAINDQWEKKLYTNDKGEVTFTLPWKTQYVVEVTKKEEVPGTYNGKEYQFIWHCATYTIPATK